MKKRAHERIPLSLEVSFIYDKTEYRGNVVNVSKNGMFITTDTPLPFRSKLQMLISFRLNLKITIPLDRKILELSARIRRLEKSGDYFNGIGVELINPPDNYLDFLSNFSDYCYHKTF